MHIVAAKIRLIPTDNMLQVYINQRHHSQAWT